MVVFHDVFFQVEWRVFVFIKDAHQLPDFYIFGSDEVVQLMGACNQYWLKNCKKDGSAREESKMIRRFQPDCDALERARNRWDLISAESLSD